MLLCAVRMAEGLEPENVVYPGAPLRAVAIEVHFAALLDAMPRFGVFQRRHAEELNRLYETSGDDFESRPDGREFARPRTAILMGRRVQRAVSVAKDHLAVITYSYASGHKGFMLWAQPMLREGLTDLGVERITGVSYRYENRIKHEARKLDLREFFNLSLASPSDAGTVSRHVHLSWDQEWTEGVVRVDLDACPNVKEDELHLNITARVESKSGSLDELDALARDSHRRARLTFEGLITSRFRDSLRSAAVS